VAPGEKNADDRVVLPTGSLTPAELQALMGTIPAEITFVDANDINAYFNEGRKDFKRPLMALGREVYSCHPPKVEAMVRRLFEEFRSGRESSFEVWHKKGGRDVLVRYLAVRDHDGTYLGTMEYVQDLYRDPTPLRGAGRVARAGTVGTGANWEMSQYPVDLFGK